MEVGVQLYRDLAITLEITVEIHVIEVTVPNAEEEAGKIFNKF